MTIVQLLTSPIAVLGYIVVAILLIKGAWDKKNKK